MYYSLYELRDHRREEARVRLLLGFLPALACIGAMIVCMRMMSGSRNSATTANRDGGDSEIPNLRDEVNRLRAELRDRQEEPPRPVTR
jgi:hypothetical protein